MSVANSYSATVNPALLCAVMRTMYHDAGSRSRTTKLLPGLTLLDTWFQSTWSLVEDEQKTHLNDKSFYKHKSKSLTFSCTRRQSVTCGIRRPSRWASAGLRCLTRDQSALSSLARSALIPWYVCSRCPMLRRRRC